MKSIKLKAIIFDMDGVITNTMPDHFKAWKRVLHKQNIPVTHYDIYRREGQRGLTSIFELFKTYKRDITVSQAYKLLNQKEELFKKITKIRFIVGARRFIRSLHRRKFKLALVTGTSRHELHKILPDSIYNCFEVIVTGNDVVNGKPHPEPYLKALRELQINPKDAIAIENAPFGIRSAKAADLKCLALETSLPRRYLKGADMILKTIHEMQRKINFSLN